jgi:hypothetical protein
MESIHQTFIVSESPDHIEPVGEEVPTEYATPEGAANAIRAGVHGDYGTRYVIKVAYSVVAEYSRPWALVRREDQS